MSSLPFSLKRGVQGILLDMCLCLFICMFVYLFVWDHSFTKISSTNGQSALKMIWEPWRRSGNTLASHLWDRSLNPRPPQVGKLAFV